MARRIMEGISEVSLIIANIYNSGKCKVYFPSSGNDNLVYELVALDNGNIKVISKKEIFDKIYWKGLDLVEESAKIVGVSGEREIPLLVALPTILACSLNKTHNRRLFIPKIDSIKKIDTTLAVDNFYGIVNKLLEMDEETLKKVAISSSGVVEGIFFKNYPKGTCFSGIKPVEAFEVMNEKILKLRNYFKWIRNEIVDDSYVDWDYLYNNGYLSKDSFRGRKY